MTGIFIKILNMSLIASYCIVFVCVLRLFLKKMPKIYSYVLWSIVGFRLLCPFSFESMFSLMKVQPDSIPRTVFISTGGLYEAVLSEAVNTAGATAEAGAVQPAAPMYSAKELFLLLCMFLWLAGIIFLAGYSISAYYKLKKQLKTAKAVSVHPDVYEAEYLTTPFVMGFFHPAIYLPRKLGGHEREYVLMHEKVHIRRKDYIIKQIAYALLCVHWFNPLVWAAFKLMTKDMEMSCDEKVLANKGRQSRKEYSMALLSLAAQKSLPMGAIGGPLAFGEESTASRIKNILSYKRPALWVSIGVIVVVAAFAVGMLTNPPKAKPEEVPEGSQGTVATGSNRKESELAGTYVLALTEEEAEAFPLLTSTKLVLHDNFFEFTIDILSSYLGIGSFSVIGEEAVLETDDGLYSFVFTIQENGNLVFSRKKSSEQLPNADEKVFEEGTVFVKQAVLQEPAGEGQAADTDKTPMNTGIERLERLFPNPGDYAYSVNEYVYEWKRDGETDKQAVYTLRGEAPEETETDFDGDGLRDYSYCYGSKGKFIIEFGNGKRLEYAGQGFGDRDIYQISALDLNGDGRNEIILMPDLGEQGGDGGYGLLVFKETSEGYEPVSLPEECQKYGGDSIGNKLNCFVEWDSGTGLSVTDGETEYFRLTKEALYQWYTEKGMEDVPETAGGTVLSIEADSFSGFALEQDSNSERGWFVTKQYVTGLGGHADRLGYWLCEWHLDAEDQWTLVKNFILY